MSRLACTVPCKLMFGIHFMTRELSLAPSWSRLTPECSSSESSDTSSSRKRKTISDSFLETKSSHATHSNIIDLQHSSERLPLDWEQCLDLESGKMYFMNRKTLNKSWDRPTTEDHHHHHHQQHISQKLDLELKISSPVSGKPKPPSVVTNKSSQMKQTELAAADQPLDIFRKDGRSRSWSISKFAGVASYKDQMKKTTTTTTTRNDNMVAMACMNCHMFVIVSKSSPTCPNCKFVHSIPTQPAARQTLTPPSP